MTVQVMRAGHPSCQGKMRNMAAMHPKAHTAARMMNDTQQTKAAAAAAAAAAACEWMHRAEHQNSSGLQKACTAHMLSKLCIEQ